MMDARAKTVREILQAGDQYLIPFFQRFYSWEMKHWARLRDDVWGLFDLPGTTLHFMGPLVCTRAPSVPTEIPAYQLIDGQQRLTTLTVFLCALRDVAAAWGNNDLAQEIEEDFLIHRRKTGLQKYKVLPRTGDREILTAMIDRRDSANTDTNVHRAHSFFRQEIEARTDGDIDKLKTLFVALTGRLSLVVITIDSENPYEIFESLNATGLPLEESDLVRNFVFMQVPQKDQESFHLDRWKSFEDTFAALGEFEAISATAFYRSYLMREGTYIKANAIFVGFKEHYKSRTLSPEVQVAELKRYAGYEVMLRRPSLIKDAPLRKSLESIEALDVTTAYPLVLKLLDMEANAALSREELLGCLDDLASFTLRRTVCGESTRAYGQWFADAIRAIGSHAQADLRKYWLKRGWPDDAAFAGSLGAFPIYRRERGKCLLMLRRLEQSYGHKERVDLSTLTIEHVMPQSIGRDKSGKAWKEMLGDNHEETHSKMLHVLGNLTLTGYNPDLSNSPYPDKRKLYAESNLRLNDYFRKVEDWTESSMAARGRVLAKESARLWARPATAESYVVGGGSGSLNEDEVGRTPEDVERFFALYEKIKPELERDVFSADSGWGKPKRSRAYACVCFCRWEDSGWEGFIIQDDDEAKSPAGRIFIAVYLAGKQHKKMFLDLIRKDEARIRRELGGRFEIDYEQTNYPVWEYVPENDPAVVVARLASYRTVFSPYLDKTLPPAVSRPDQKNSRANKKDWSERHFKRIEFWKTLLEKCSAKTRLFSAISPGRYHWIGAGAGRSGVSFSFTLLTEQAGVELYIDHDRKTGKKNKAIFDALLSDKVAIEKDFGGPLVWERLNDRRACRISSVFLAGGLKNQKSWPALQEVMIDGMIRLENCLHRRFEKIEV